MKTGIYKITNIKTKKIYIGSSENIQKRWLNHKQMLFANKHHSIHLQRSYNKHGEKSFSYEIIELCDKSLLLERENFYLNELLKADEYVKGVSGFFIKFGYNICPIASKGFTGKHSRDSILKQIKSRGLCSTLKVDINGNILEEYELVSDIKDKRSAVYLSKRNKQTLKSKNYGYISKNDYYDGYKPKQTTTWNKGLTGLDSHNKKKIYVYDLYGRFYKTYDSIKDASISLNVSVSNISKVLNIKHRKKLGRIGNKSLYRFFTTPVNFNNMLEFNTQPDDIKIYSLFNEFLGYSCKAELSSKLKVSKTFINEVLNGRRKYCKFYKLKRNDIV